MVFIITAVGDIVRRRFTITVVGITITIMVAIGAAADAISGRVSSVA